MPLLNLRGGTHGEEALAVGDPRPHTQSGQGGLVVIFILFGVAWIVVLSVSAWLVVRAKPRS